MKSLIEYILAEEAAATNSTEGVANPDSKPLFSKSKFAGVDCIDVDSGTYDRCKFGKAKYTRWSGNIEDSDLRTFVQKHYYKSDKLIVKNASTGAMAYIKK